MCEFVLLVVVLYLVYQPCQAGRFIGVDLPSNMRILLITIHSLLSMSLQELAQNHLHRYRTCLYVVSITFYNCSSSSCSTVAGTTEL